MTSKRSGKTPVGTQEFDPEDFRMSLGDHLEELRSRLLKAIAFFMVAAVFCMWFGDRVMAGFCKPLVDGLVKHNYPPQLITTGLTDSFAVYMNVSLIASAVFAAPFALYQIWQFVAAGLYPKERKYVTKYMPFSLTLLIVGMVFLYLVVLPITVNFLIGFGSEIESPRSHPPVTRPTSEQVLIIPTIHGDPANPLEHQLWYDDFDGKLKFSINKQIRSIQMGSDKLLSPMIDLRDYINLVLSLLLVFGLSFQLPLVVMALGRTGIVEIETLKKSRRVVILLIAVASAAIVPDVVTGMLALMFPMIFLYELGIHLAVRSKRQAEKAEAEEEARVREEERQEREKHHAATPRPEPAAATPTPPAEVSQLPAEAPQPPAEPPLPPPEQSPEKPKDS